LERECEQEDGNDCEAESHARKDSMAGASFVLTSRFCREVNCYGRETADSSRDRTALRNDNFYDRNDNFIKGLRPLLRLSVPLVSLGRMSPVRRYRLCQPRDSVMRWAGERSGMAAGKQVPRAKKKALGMTSS
jgi:hypothetical protein